MKLRVLIRIAVIVSIVLLCTGFGVYSFLRMNAVENRQDFNLFTLVPQDATAVLETDRMADLMEDVDGLHCSKDEHFLYVSELFVYLKKYFNTLEAWRISEATAGESAPASGAPVFDMSDGSDDAPADDLPF